MNGSIIVVKALRSVLSNRLYLETLSLFHHTNLIVLLEAAYPLPCFISRVAIFIRHPILLSTDVFLIDISLDLLARSDPTAAHVYVATLGRHRCGLRFLADRALSCSASLLFNELDALL